MRKYMTHLYQLSFRLIRLPTFSEAIRTIEVLVVMKMNILLLLQKNNKIKFLLIYLHTVFIFNQHSILGKLFI